MIGSRTWLRVATVAWLVGCGVVSASFSVVFLAADGEDLPRLLTADQQRPEDLPSLLTADDQRPVETPTDGEQVAVIRVNLTRTGEVITAEVDSRTVIDSFSPKSVARSGGEWEVRILGANTLSYSIPNPFFDIEAENSDDSTEAYNSVVPTALEWTLIVPLYHEGDALDAFGIEVVDSATGSIILETDI